MTIGQRMFRVSGAYAVAWFCLLPGCDSALVPETAHPPANTVTDLRPGEIVHGPGFSMRHILPDPQAEHDREWMIGVFRRSLLSADTEHAEHLDATIRRLEGWPVSEDQVQQTTTTAEDEATPRAVTYMRFTPESGTYSLSGTTFVQTEGALARIQHDLSYRVGSRSYRVPNHYSNSYRREFTTWVEISCDQPTTVSGQTLSTRWFNSGHITSGQGILDSHICRRLDPTGCGPDDPSIRDGGYDPYYSDGSCGTGSEGGSMNCTQEYIVIEVYDDATGQWQTWWSGYVLVCE
jgi:hypothetical protein